MTRPFQIGKMYRTDGRPVTLPDAILADGHTMRVRTMQRDAAPSAAGFCKECQDEVGGQI